MDIFDAYEMDDEAVSKGVWGELVVRGQTIGRIRCRSSDPDINKAYRKGLNVAGIALAAMRESNKTPEEIERASDELTCGLLADTVLTDWELYETIKSGKNKGKERKIPFSKERAKKLLLKLPKLRAAVEGCAAGWTKFRKGQIDETVKI